MNILRGVPIAIISGLLGAHLFAAEITVSVDKPGAAISPTFYGAFFEDINRAGDGGLYAEMLQNRSFEDAAIPLGWMLLKTGNAEGAMSLDKTQPLNAKNPTCLKLEITNAGNGRVGIVNQGFKGAPMDEKIPNADAQKKWFPKFAAAAEKSKQGLNVVQGKEYVLTLYAKSSAIATLTVALEKQDGTSLAEQEIKGIDAGWKKLEVRFTAKGSDTNARLTISANKPGTLFLDMVSLFPKDTWKGRPNGLRPDMAQMLADMHPGLLRFPGGSFSEAHQL
ncbi:TPA: hypothetical protein DDW35_05860, partial [Candidatus Sumerlaeota bacterium]|nr:hypothetical protein [Candidatus Sumerlaeota bacterium]